MSAVSGYPNIGKAEIAYLSMAAATLQEALSNIRAILRCVSGPHYDDAERWNAVCGDLRIYAGGANELLSRVIANAPDLECYLHYHMEDALLVEESELEWVQVAGKGYALHLAALSEHVGNQLGGSGSDRIKAAREFIERRHRSLVGRLRMLGRQHEA